MGFRGGGVVEDRDKGYVVGVEFYWPAEQSVPPNVSGQNYWVELEEGDVES